MSHLGKRPALIVGSNYFDDMFSSDSQEVLSSFGFILGKENLVQNVTLLHCTTEYPAPYSSINLNALDLMRDKFGIPIGYSDHSNGISVSLAAVSKGARIIEKHFTLDKNLAGPDHKASIDPEELKTLVNEIRNIQISLGDYIKAPTAVEKKNIHVARKSILSEYLFT